MAAQAAAAAAAGGGNPNAAGNGSSTLPAGGDPLSQPMALSAVAAADVRRVAVRTYVVPLLIGLATTSSSTRAKLWASNGLDIFLQLLGIEVSCWLGGRERGVHPFMTQLFVAWWLGLGSALATSGVLAGSVVWLDWTLRLVGGLGSRGKEV